MGHCGTLTLGVREMRNIVGFYADKQIACTYCK